MYLHYYDDGCHYRDPNWYIPTPHRRIAIQYHSKVIVLI